MKTKKATRTARVDVSPTQSQPGILILNDKVPTFYFISRSVSECGSAWRLGKFRVGEKLLKVSQRETYFVVIAASDNENGEGDGHECDCKGFLCHGHCKHILALQALMRRGKLL